MPNQRFQPTVKSVIFFAKAKKLPLFTAAEAVVNCQKTCLSKSPVKP
jgi:hypothetical protein